MFGRDLSHSSYIRDGGGIDRESVKRLQPVWTTSAGARLAAAVSLADGVLYYGAWDGNFYAASAVDGAVLWKNFVGIAATPENPRCFPVIGVSSQAAIAGDKVYIGGGDAAVYAFDRATGAQLWRLPLGDPNSGAYIWSSPTIYNNALYIGLAFSAVAPTFVEESCASISITPGNRWSNM